MVRGGGGIWGQNICYHVATFHDTNKFDMQHDNVLKKLNFDLLTPSPRVVREGGGWSACKTFATMLLHFVFPIYLICIMTLF